MGNSLGGDSGGSGDTGYSDFSYGFNWPSSFGAGSGTASPTSAPIASSVSLR